MPCKAVRSQCSSCNASYLFHKCNSNTFTIQQYHRYESIHHRSDMQQSSKDTQCCQWGRIEEEISSSQEAFSWGELKVYIYTCNLYSQFFIKWPILRSTKQRGNYFNAHIVLREGFRKGVLRLHCNIFIILASNIKGNHGTP